MTTLVICFLLGICPNVNMIMVMAMMVMVMTMIMVMMVMMMLLLDQVPGAHLLLSIRAKDVN